MNFDLFLEILQNETDKVSVDPTGKLCERNSSTGMASGINQVAMAIVQITMNNILRKYGAQSDYGADIPIACAGIISKVNMIFMSIGIGISQGCQPIFGFNYGAEKYSRVRETYRKAATAAVVAGIVIFHLLPDLPATDHFSVRRRK